MKISEFPVLGDLSADQFLRDYWQKKPLMIRQAFHSMEPPVSPDELAGLACEEDVESRILLRHSGEQEWVLHPGPFQEQDFARLPENNWTLLVQAVDHWMPEVRELLEDFRFIPDWRLDDIMISYATEGGGVGPHYDNYDVFLIQAAGQRHWQTGQQCNDDTPLLPHPDLKILSEFIAENDFHLNPGDMLYLPPGVAHWGTATSNDCMTLSVGFRAPSHAEMACDYGHWLSDHVSDFLRYADSDLTLQVSPSEITHKSIGRVQRILREYADCPERVAQWFGRLMTEPKYPERPVDDTQPITAEVWVASDARLAWHQPVDQETLYLFANGESYPLPLPFKKLVTMLCEERYFSESWLHGSPANTKVTWKALLKNLLKCGVLISTE